MKKLDLFLVEWGSKTLVTTLVLSQALNNSYSHYIRKLKIKYVCVIRRERIVLYISVVLGYSMWGICDEKYDWLRLNGVYVRGVSEKYPTCIGAILRHPDHGILESSPHLIEPHAPSGASTT